MTPEEVQKELSSLSEGLAFIGRKAISVVRSAISRAASHIAWIQRHFAPLFLGKYSQKSGKKPGALRRSIGSVVAVKAADAFVKAKIGLDVGTKPGNAGKYAPHGHLNALGTVIRATKQGKNRGRMTPNNFIKRGTDAAMPTAINIIVNTTREGIEKAAAEI